jgi:DNA-binding GntR family transcriptional regulator
LASTPLEKSLPYYSQVYHSIKQMIFQGIFQPGERIYEAKIAREFEVSRSPVREAVRALITDGLLVIDDKSQISVYNPTMEDVEDIYQCRMVLESFAARLATQRASDEELAEIAIKLEETEQLINSQDQPKDEAKLIDLNGQFHDLIQQYSGNKRLQKQLEDLRTLAYYYRVKNFQGEHRAKVIHSEHYSIFRYMRERNEVDAAAAMEQHIQHDLAHLKKILNGEFSPEK